MKKRRNKKKGSLIIEQLLIYPIMIGVVWLIMQMIIFVYSNDQVNTAATETSQVMSQMLRGTDKQLNEIDNGNKDIIVNEALKILKSNLDQNAFVMLAKDYTQTPDVEHLRETAGVVQGFVNYTSEVEGEDERVLLILENKSLCETTLQESDKKRAVCIYTEDNLDSSLAKTSQQVVVRVKAPFRLIGSIIPGVKDKISLYGNGVATKEIAGRFQYY